MYVSQVIETCDGPVVTALFDKVGVLGSTHACMSMHIDSFSFLFSFIFTR